MKYVLYSFMLIGLLVTPALAAPPTEFPSPQSSSPPPGYLVRIYSIEKDGSRSMGTGTLVRDNIVLTASHVVNGDVGSTVEVLFHSDWSVVEGEVVYADSVTSVGKDGTGLDIAFIKIQPRTEKPCPIGWNTHRGSVSIHGYAYGPHLRQIGEYYSDDESHRWGIIAGAQARNGDSGGPVMQSGKIVGVLWGAAPNVTWFTPIRSILKLEAKLIERKEHADIDVKYSL